MSQDYKEAAADPWGFAKKYIIDNELDMKEIHEATGIPWSTVRSWFNGNREQPNQPNLSKLMSYIISRIEGEEKNDGNSTSGTVV